MRISDLSSDVCSSDLDERQEHVPLGVPDVPLGGEEGVALGAGGQRHPPFEHLEQRAEGEADRGDEERQPEIGRASCRERVCQYVSISVVAVSLKKTNR